MVSISTVRRKAADVQFFDVVGSRSKRSSCASDDEADAAAEAPREANLMVSEKISAAFDATAV